MTRTLTLGVLAAVVALAAGSLAGATPYGSDTLVTSGSPTTHFPQNKQYGPAVAVNPAVPTIAAASATDEIDLEACNNGNDKTCPFTPGVGISGIYFSDDSGSSWTQPTYTGWTARDCLGVVGTNPSNPADNCTGHVGPIGTVPRYYENGLVANGDPPALAFGPRAGADGSFSWTNGWRLYYADQAANFPSSDTTNGFRAVAVSRLDSENYAAAKAGDNDAWMDPVIVTKQNTPLFTNRPMIAVDDAASSPFFGNVYVCDAAFRGAAEIIRSHFAPEPIVMNTSSDGGDTWTHAQLSPAVNNPEIGGRQNCGVDTDSNGVVYVFWAGNETGGSKAFGIFLTRSFDGGHTFDKPRLVTPITQTGIVDDFGTPTFEGASGSPTGSFPTISIANGAPGGADATDQIVLAWSEGPTPSATSPGPNERALVLWSRDQGETWTAAGSASPASDRPDLPAIAISPDGGDVYVDYMNFLQPWQPSALAPPRLMQGVVRHADVDRATGAIGAWSDLNRGPTGDARTSAQNNLVRGFFGPFEFAAATNDFVVAVWNDARNGADCPAMDVYRQMLLEGTASTSSSDPNRPAPNNDCPATFGNTDAFGGSYADPTP